MIHNDAYMLGKNEEMATGESNNKQWWKLDCDRAMRRRIRDGASEHVT